MEVMGQLPRTVVQRFRLCGGESITDRLRRWSLIVSDDLLGLGTV
jgi:hypothetical protein